MSGSTRRLRKLRGRVLRQEPLCWLRLDGCTRIATTVDHVILVSQRPDLKEAPWNLKGACGHCNKSRGRTPIGALPNRTESPTALQFFNP